MLQEADPTKEYPRRSLMLLAMGALLGLALAGYGLFTATGSEAARIPEGAIALVNNRMILLSDYRAQLEALYDVALDKSTAEQRKAVLDSMITEELFVQRGLEIELPASDASVREALVAGVQRASTADLEAKKPAEDELKAWFAAHRDQYRSTGMMSLRHLVAPAGSPRSAQQAAQALRKGLAPDAAIARFGLKEAATPGRDEQPDIAVKRALGDVLYAEADKLSAGQVSDPVADDEGVHILVMVGRRLSVPLEFEAAREGIASDIKRDARRRAQEEYARFLRGKAEILLAPGYGP